jgi:hypothetical protein
MPRQCRPMPWATCEVTEAKPVGGTGGVKSLAPKQSRTNQERRNRANAHIQDVQATNAVRLATAQRKASEL